MAGIRKSPKCLENQTCNAESIYRRMIRILGVFPPEKGGRAASRKRFAAWAAIRGVKGLKYGRFRPRGGKKETAPSAGAVM